MTYRALWILVIGAAIGIALWIGSNLERVEVTIDGTYSGEALRNPYFATREFLNGVQVDATTVASAMEVFPLPDVDTVILIPGLRSGLTGYRHQELLAWVESGGHLMVSVRHAVPWLDDEQSIDEQRDPLLDPLGLYRDWVDAGEFDEESHEDGQLRGKRDTSTSHNKLVLDDGRIQVNYGDPFYQITWNERQPDNVFRVNGRPVVVSHRIGAGRITSALGYEPFDNHHLNEADNAAGFWYLVNLHRDQSAVKIVISDQMPSLPLWIWRNYSSFVIPAALLILLWIWRSTPRFGSLRTVDSTRSRSLRTHLAAAGRYYWRNGRLQDQLNTRREILWQALSRHPGHAVASHRPIPLQQNRDEALSHVAELLDCPVGILRRALIDAAQTPGDIVASVRAIQFVEGQIKDGRFH